MAKHNELGRLGEQFAADYLSKNGYTIIEIDWQYEHKDLDIVAFDPNDNVLVFVEVKTRANYLYGDPSEAVNHRKMQNLIRCANLYIKIKNYHGNSRFDVISLVGHDSTFELSHVKDAFNAATAFQM